MLNAKAQLKVHSNGYVSIQTNQSSVLSPLTLGGNGTKGYQLAYSGSSNGIRILSTAISDSLYCPFAGTFSTLSTTGRGCTGLYGKATRYDNSFSTATGVMGEGSSASSPYGETYGIYGLLGNGNNGAAVYGRICNYSSTSPDGRYAGFFAGPTKVSGNFTVTGAIQGTILGYAASAANADLQRNLFVSESVSDKILGLDIMVFNHQPHEAIHICEKDAAISEDFSTELHEFGIDDAPKEQMEDVINKQIQSKAHYALDADQLERFFPNLVYIQNDGTKSINYMEMIPLLVQSINELQAQISQLTGQESSKRNLSTAFVNKTYVSQAVLYQNSPNPFTECTEIRFSLPENTTNANICIFDMSGKMLKQIPVNSSMQNVTINGYELQAGMYLYSLVIGGQEVDTKRMVLSK